MKSIRTGAIFVALLLIIGFVAAADSETRAEDAITVTLRPVAMHSPPQPDSDRRVGALRFIAGYELHSSHKAFGGVSGVEISADGRHMLGITDRGHWLWLQFDLDGDVPDTVSAARIAPMRGEDGTALGKGLRDSESLVLLDGRALVAFETRDMVRSFSHRGDDRTDPLSDPDLLLNVNGADAGLPSVMLDHPSNGGLEAMARLRDGALLAFSEKGRDDADHLRAWLYKDARARALSFVAPKGFYPTDAALMPDGDILVLMRHFTPLTGVAAKLVRISADDIRPGAVLYGEDIATLSPPLSIDNMEGLALRRGADGRLLLYMMADDNFSPMQRSLLLIYALPGED